MPRMQSVCGVLVLLMAMLLAGMFYGDIETPVPSYDDRGYKPKQTQPQCSNVCSPA